MAGAEHIRGGAQKSLLKDKRKRSEYYFWTLNEGFLHLFLLAFFKFCKQYDMWHEITILAEHWQPKAAMRSPTPIEPMHSFSYGHPRQCLMVCGRLRTYDDDENVAQHGAHTGQLMHCIHILEIHFMVNWQLSNLGILWPVPHDHIAGSGWNSLWESVFLKLTADQVIYFHRIAGSGVFQNY